MKWRKNPQQSREDRVQDLHADAWRDYADGQEAREGLDRAERHRREMWGDGK